jgi:hypothetical protein
MVRALRQLRFVAKTQLLFQRTGTLLAGLLGIALAFGLIDYLVRFPMAVRIIAWGIGLAILAALIRQRLWPALRFTPSLTQLALRLEQSPKGREAGLEGVLASGLELASSSDLSSSPLHDSLRTLSTADAVTKFRALAWSAGILKPNRLLGAVGMLALAIVPIAVLSARVPKLAGIGAQRVLTPWADVSWPKRTMLADPGHPAAHPLGAALPFRAALLETNRPPGKTQVVVNYRVRTAAGSGPMRRLELTPQQRSIIVDSGSDSANPNLGSAVDPASNPSPDPAERVGELYERLIDLSGGGDVPAANASSTEPRRAELEYFFETADDQTPTATIILVDPPAIQHATIEVAAPDYAKAMLAALAASAASRDSSAPTAGASREKPPFITGVVPAGPGSDQRASVGPVLAGSRVIVNLSLNKPVPVPTDDEQKTLAPAAMAYLTRVMPGLEAASGLVMSLKGTSWTIAFEASTPVRVPVLLQDEFGIVATDEAAFRFDVVEDRPPSATIIEPPQDEAVLPTAVIDAAAEGRDDVGLINVELRAQAAKPPAGSVGAAPDAVGEAAVLTTSTPGTSAGTSDGTTTGTGITARANATIEITTYKLVSGDELWLTGVARDLLSAADLSRKPATSSKRRLRIISESELVEQVRAELVGVREAAKRLVEEQDRLATRRPSAVQDPDAASEQAPRQSAVADRLGPMSKSVERLQKRLDRNKLDDAGLKGLLDDAGKSAQDAREAADKATASLDQLAKKDARTPESAKEQGESLQKAQDTVQQELSRLVSMLDRGEDSWAVRRSLERLLTEQKQLRAQTANAGAQTQGAKREELSTQEREDLERLARRQEELAQRSAAAAEQLAKRAEQMAKTDPAQSKAMENAAQQARSSQLDATQREAGKQIQQNQTQQAQENQQRAEQAIKDILEELDKSEQKKDEVLRRLLADVMESLQRLIAQQDDELAVNARVLAGEKIDNWDAGMIALNRNTLGVRDQVAEAMENATSLLSILSAATSAQSAAIKAIRNADAAEADGNERVSLARLKDALAEAQRLEQEAAKRDDSRKRDELRKSYREALELQVALQAETTPFVGKDVTRRDRPKVRSLGEKQEELRQRMEALRSGTQEIADAPVLNFEHDRLDRDMRLAATTLTAGDATSRVGRSQASAVATLKAIIDSLGDPPKRDDEFREDENSGGGGGGGAGGQEPLIPPIMQLRLLRARQADVALRTRSLDEAQNQRANAKLPADPEEAEELTDLTDLQRHLAEHGQKLLDALKPKEGPQSPEPGEPEDNPADNPADKPAEKPAGKPEPKPGDPK